MFEDVITIFGIPAILLSDQGRNFESKLFGHKKGMLYQQAGICTEHFAIGTEELGFYGSL